MEMERDRTVCNQPSALTVVLPLRITTEKLLGMQPPKLD
jgi:hypothetical protein